MLAGTVTRQHLHVSGVGRRAIEQLGREMRPPHDLAQRRVFKVGQAGAVLALGQEQVPETRLPGFGLQFLDDRENLPGPQILGLLIELVFVRIDVAVHE